MSLHSEANEPIDSIVTERRQTDRKRFVDILFPQGER